MSIERLVGTIIVPSLVGLGFVFFGILMYVFSKKRFNTKMKNTRIFQIDLFSRRVKPIDDKIQYDFSNFIFKLPYGDKWFSLREVTSYLDNENLKLFRNALNEMENDAAREEIQISQESQGNLLKMNFSFIKKENGTDIIMIIKWEESKNFTKSNDSKSNMFDKLNIKPNDIVEEFSIDEISSNAYGLIALNMNNEIDNVKYKIFKILRKTKILKKHNIIIHDHLFIIVLKSKKNNIDLVNKKVKRMINKLEKKGIKYGLNILHNGSGSITIKSISTKNDYTKIISLLEYFIILSISKKQSFISRETYDLKKDKNAFQDFIQSIKVFKTVVKRQSSDTRLFEVKSSKTNEKIIDYAMPNIQGIDKQILDKILINKNNIVSLMNAHAYKIAIDKKINIPVIIEINEEWLTKYKDEIKYKNAIYIVHVYHKHSYLNLVNLFYELKKKGFTFGIKPHIMNEYILAFITQIKPDFIVIGNEFMDNSERSNSILKTLRINNMALSNKIKTIFENPSSKINVVTRKNIGLDFYFETQKD